MYFDKLYTQNYRLVYILACKIVKDDEVSKDITQEVFLKLHRFLSDGKQVLNIEAWLSRTTYNHCLNYLRDSKKWQFSKLSESEDAENVSDMSLIRDEESRQLRYCLRLLNEKEQIIISLYSKGMTYKEIAEISGLRFSSVGTTLARSLAKLKKLYNYENS
ncbi:MAG: sigma-70 family RNA polymerase sigma factor [Bacteroidales bacterium]|jgi:RNA polymerase sigma-70 factor (ECF subfamily)|nr:sigma-70 family RNA polymerase sigma factor [Bacteroidales bacterium]